MAGDVGFEEQVIVAPARVEGVLAAAVQLVDEGEGRVSHQYGPRVLVVEEVAEVGEAVAAQVPGGAVAATMADVGISLAADLDETGTLGLEAFALRSSEEYVGTKAQRPLAGESWGNKDASTPDYDDVEGDAAAAAPAGAATSARLTDSVAVGIIIVEGPTAALEFSDEDRIKVVAEVQNGLSWLGAQNSSGGVKWVYDIQIVTLTTEPDPGSLSLEALWRDPAMSQLGFGTGMAAVNSYVQKLRADFGTRWAYCAFFTKYPVPHFAYASIGGPRLVMHFGNDGWGPDNIDRVFAHETGHIFGAPDEYASSNCNCGGSWGFFNKPNENCATCVSGGGVDCLMRANSWAMCGVTPWHLGFPQGTPLPLAAGIYTLRQKSSNRFLDAYQSSRRDFSVVTRPPQHNDTQRWRFTPVGMVHTIEQLSSDRLLDAHENTAKDYSAVTRGDQGNDTQKWVAIHVAAEPEVNEAPPDPGEGTTDPEASFGIGVPDQLPPSGTSAYTLQQLSSGRFLDAHQNSFHDFSAVTRRDQGNDTQRWVVAALGDGAYTVVQLSSGRFLDALESTGSDFSAVTRIAQNNDTQRWRFTPVGAVYDVQQVSSDRHVDAHESSANDFSVVTRGDQNDDTQRWVITHLGGDGYSMQQLSSGRLLDAHQSSAKDFSVVTRADQDNDTQRWIIA
jgi:hypothetical protein